MDIRLANRPSCLIQKHSLCLSLLSAQLTETDEKWTKLILLQFNSLISVVFAALNQATWPQLPKASESSPNWTLLPLIWKPHILFFTHSPDFSRCWLLMCLRTWDVSIMAQRDRLFALCVSAQLWLICHFPEYRYQNHWVANCMVWKEPPLQHPDPGWQKAEMFPLHSHWSTSLSWSTSLTCIIWSRQSILIFKRFM